MKTALLITTYNRPDALEVVLLSVLKQSRLPEQVIIADDGSGKDTTELIRKYQEIFPIDLIHSWQEDLGFRASQSRNKALSKVTSDYVIMIDGDIILHPEFIKDHIDNAKLGYFIQGGRSLLTPTCTQRILNKPNLYKPINYLTKGLDHRLEKRLLYFRAPWLSKVFKKQKGNPIKSIRTCNISFFFKDLCAVNGFDNNFVGWGSEDVELVVRLLNNGLKRNDLKFAALGYHLYHKEESKLSEEKNVAILQKSIVQKLIFCENGLNRFLNIPALFWGNAILQIIE